MNDSAELTVARGVLNIRTVRLSLVIVVVLALLGGTAVAGEVEDRVAKISKLGERRAKADADRKDVEQRYQQKTKEIEKLKGQRSSWARDDKLKKRLGEARDMASALDKTSADIRAIDTSLRAERTALVKAIDAELAGSPSEARKAKLAKLRGETVARLPRKLRVADEDIDPLDDPEDLDDKARALAESEKDLRDEEQRLERRVKYYRKQARLARARSRAEEDPFGDDQPRRKKGGGRTQTTGNGDDMGATDMDPAAPPPAPEDTDDGFTAGETGRDDVTGGDPAVEYEDVVEPETVDELRRAEKSGDPETRAKAAERAKKDIAARAERLKKKRLEIERRARELRGE